MAIKQLGKKGMFLTFIAIAIISALMIIFAPPNISLSADTQALNTKVSNVNEYVTDLENVYLERTLYAIGTKTIIALIEYMEAQGVFLTDFEDNFEEVLLYGTIEGVDIDTYYAGEIMTDNTYGDWVDKITATAKDAFNIDTVYGVSEIIVYQTTPWVVDVGAKLSFNISSEIASWNKTAIIKTQIEIENFYDPYYLVNTGGSYENKIRKSGTGPGEWDVEEVKAFIRGDGNYTHWESSPSFLMRFTDDTSASSCCGIESLVNPNNVPDKDTSYVDYLYWESSSPCPNNVLYSVNGMDNEFKLYSEGISRYGLQDDDYLHCPPPPP